VEGTVTEPLVSTNSTLLWGELLHKNKRQTLTLNPEATKLSAERLKIIKYIRVRPLQKCADCLKVQIWKGERQQKIDKQHKYEGQWTLGNDPNCTQFWLRGWDVILGDVGQSKSLISSWRRGKSMGTITATNERSGNLLEAWHNKRGYYYKLEDKHPWFSKVLKYLSHSLNHLSFSLSNSRSFISSQFIAVYLSLCTVIQFLAKLCCGYKVYLIKISLLKWKHQQIVFSFSACVCECSNIISKNVLLTSPHSYLTSSSDKPTNTLKIKIHAFR
jgi:hypothetical protein